MVTADQRASVAPHIVSRSARRLDEVVTDRMDQIRIRAAGADDLPVLIPLINKAFAVEEFIDGARTDEERLSATLRSGEILIAELDGRALASVYVELRGERAYFGMLAVDPAQQGRGFGKYMTEAAEKYARDHGCKFMEINVLSLRPELLRFYQKLGYRETGTEEFKPSRPLKGRVACHCIVMSKVL